MYLRASAADIPCCLGCNRQETGSDGSLRYDRAVKLPLYAQAGIGEVWIVDLHRLVVDAHRTPAGDGYATVETHGPEGTVTLGLAPEIAVALRRVFA